MDLRANGATSEALPIPNVNEPTGEAPLNQGSHEVDMKSLNLPHSKKMLEVLGQVFKLGEFRQNQLESINAALLGFDVFVLMPTGGGKSLCYQLPAMVSPGVTFVVSPLLSLILDQETKMNKLSLGCAASLTGETDTQTTERIFADLDSPNPKIKLIFTTPEKLSLNSSLISKLVSLHDRNLLARFVVDEAHCIVQWGNNFRTAYGQLGDLRRQFPRVPISALTATATEKVLYFAILFD